MSVAEADQYLGTTFRPLLAVHSSDALYRQALYLVTERSLSWYDALILASAVEGRCAVLYSEDV
jgi:predicted nucleic acid-binding protein